MVSSTNEVLSGLCFFLLGARKLWSFCSGSLLILQPASDSLSLHVVEYYLPYSNQMNQIPNSFLILEEIITWYCVGDSSFHFVFLTVSMFHLKKGRTACQAKLAFSRVPRNVLLLCF